MNSRGFIVFNCVYTKALVHIHRFVIVPNKRKKMKSHTGEKPRHSFTPHIKIIRVPNSKTVFAICK
ncbi:40914_t:CDS:2 [Gigaspora margarita]|uniref:40914_t:CDS:1 n=1 Tax=Gigaspora margarita TaxID=4874 RepID=A0ABN7UFZ8_GIGMA|nr:40914_t:CDS:2 [Gigaspora margarita]